MILKILIFSSYLNLWGRFPCNKFFIKNNHLSQFENHFEKAEFWFEPRVSDLTNIKLIEDLIVNVFIITFYDFLCQTYKILRYSFIKTIDFKKQMASSLCAFLFALIIQTTMISCYQCACPKSKMNRM